MTTMMMGMVVVVMVVLRNVLWSILAIDIMRFAGTDVLPRDRDAHGSWNNHAKVQR